MIWIASNTALTVIIPPNPALARLLNTVTFPFDFVSEALWLMIPSRLGCHGKLLEIRVFDDTGESNC